jgi:hypothetical protein
MSTHWDLEGVTKIQILSAVYSLPYFAPLRYRTILSRILVLSIIVNFPKGGLCTFFCPAPTWAF